MNESRKIISSDNGHHLPVVIPHTLVPTPGESPPVNGKLTDIALAHPASAKARPKKPVDYVLVHQPPAWLLAPAIDKRERSGADYQIHFARFTADVKARGVLQPIIAVRVGEVGQVVDGETRRLAALMAGIESVPILLTDRVLSDAELVFAQLQANAHRRDFTPLELAEIYLQLQRLNGWSQVELAQHVNISAAQIAKILAISTKLCPEVRALVAANELPVRSAYAISRIEDAPTQIELAKLAKESLCVEGVEAQVAKHLGRGKKTKARPIKVTLNGLTIIFNSNDLQQQFATIESLVAAMRKLEKFTLPLAALSNILKQ